MMLWFHDAKRMDRRNEDAEEGIRTVPWKERAPWDDPEENGSDKYAWMYLEARNML
jgi:hypothetical protein